MQNPISLYGQTKQHPSLTEKIQASTLWQFPARKHGGETTDVGGLGAGVFWNQPDLGHQIKGKKQPPGAILAENEDIGTLHVLLLMVQPEIWPENQPVEVGS